MNVWRVVGWVVCCAMFWFSGFLMGYRSDSNRFTPAEIERAKVACTAMGGELFAQYGTDDEDIGRILHLKCVPATAPRGTAV